MQEVHSERRAHFRVATNASCFLAVRRQDTWDRHPARLTDISLTGAQIECASPLTVGMRVQLSIPDMNLNPMDARITREVVIGSKTSFGIQLHANWPPEVFYSLAFPGEKIEAGEVEEEAGESLPWTDRLGYEVVRQIGHGGSGAVFEVRAPGGFLKALKRIPLNSFGPMSLRELWGFRLIRAIRHPFLLSIDRLTVEEGHLVIVMELAEGSLNDQFRSYRRRGKNGIPRQRLLPWLLEAAEVLDLLNLKHDLQHLDIKPDNLFLVGDHLKVGDYGLLRPTDGEVLDTNLNAMTPGYAAPELYDGRASRTSDQFSLAAVYTEMLTGSRPFTGLDARQIVFQMLTRGPDLDNLPEADREIVARAFSHQPGQRYESCGEFVQALMRESVAVRVFDDEQPSGEFDLAQSAVSEDSRVVRNATTILQGPFRSSPSTGVFKAQSRPITIPESKGPSLALIAIYNNVGKLQLKNKKIEGALEAFQQALDVGRQLAQDDTNEHLAALAAVECNLGKTYQLQGSPAEAVASYEQAAVIRQRLMERGVADSAKKLSSVYVRIGSLYKELGNTAEAVHSLQRVCQLTEDQFRDSAPNPNELRRQASQWAELASLQKQAGEPALALQSLEKAREVREILFSLDDSDETYSLEVAVADQAVGALEQELGRLKQAESALNRAKQRLQELVRRFPEKTEYTRLYAAVLNDVGVVLQKRGRLKEALACYHLARDFREKLVWEQPDVLQYTKDLAAAYNNIGAVAQQLGQWDSALESCQKALELRQVLANENSDKVEFLRDHAAALHNLGLLYQSTNRAENAKNCYHRASEIRGSLVSRFPTNPEFARELSSTLCRIASLSHSKGEHDDALRVYREARSLQEKLVQQHPAIPRYRDTLAFTLHQIASLHADLNEQETALAEFDRAIELKRSLLHENSTSVSYVQSLSVSLRSLAMLRQTRKEWELGLNTCDEAVQSLKKLLEEVPDEVSCRRELALVYFRKAALLRASKSLEEALSQFSLASDLQYQLVREHPDSLEFRSDLGATLHDRGSLLNETGRVDQAIAALSQAAEQHRLTLEQVPENLTCRRWLSDDYRRLTMLYHQQGRLRDAVQNCLQRKSLWAGDPTELYRSARELAVTAKLAQRASKHNSADDFDRRVTKLAIQTLREAVENGWTDFEKIRNDSFFKSLHSDLMQEIL